MGRIPGDRSVLGRTPGRRGHAELLAGARRRRTARNRRPETRRRHRRAHLAAPSRPHRSASASPRRHEPADARRLRHPVATSAEPTRHSPGHGAGHRRPSHPGARPRGNRQDADHRHPAGPRTPWATVDAYPAIASNSLAIWAGATSTLHC